MPNDDPPPRRKRRHRRKQWHDLDESVTILVPSIVRVAGDKLIVTEIVPRPTKKLRLDRPGDDLGKVSE